MNILKKAVFALKSHGPQANQRAKTQDHVGVVLQVVMFWQKCLIRKCFLVFLPVIRYFALKISNGFFCKYLSNSKFHYLF